MKVLKFGGKSLSNGAPLSKVLQIIQSQNGPLALILSARGNSTNMLDDLYQSALRREPWEKDLLQFIRYQEGSGADLDLGHYHWEMAELLKAIEFLGEPIRSVHDQLLAYGEVLSALSITELLRKEGLKVRFADSRKLIIVSVDGRVDLARSKKMTQSFFGSLEEGEIPVITGFIAADSKGRTTTLGRNGSNYTATLIASFIYAEEVQNWTDIDGVYTASPKYVRHARKIDHLSYREANELANFGADILHSRTIHPLLESAIPLRIYNSFSPDADGTLIDQRGSGKGIKAVSAIEDVSLVTIEGRGLCGKIGIDARIFGVLGAADISVRLISQASSERGVGFVIDRSDAEQAATLLRKEFKEDFQIGDISNIGFNNDMAIIAIVGRHNYSLEKAIQGLRRNGVRMHLISNSISGEHISLVVDKHVLRKAVNVVHNQVFGASKTLNLFAFGKGNVGGRLLDQIISTRNEIVEHRNLVIRIVGVADSKKFVFSEDGLGNDWREKLAKSTRPTEVKQILEELKHSGLENIVIADNTSSLELTRCYPEIIHAGIDIVASNKKANSISYDFYEELRGELKKKERLFLYETNVGAGLPLIDTIKNLYSSSDRIERIRGVFSGSLSYIFNSYSIEDVNFSDILQKAVDLGLTEPDPREDLSGLDVARKLMILAREVGLKVEFEDVKVEGLVPDTLADLSEYEEFKAGKDVLDAHYGSIKAELKEGEVLRYVGDLNIKEGQLKVSLDKFTENSPLGTIRNADSIFEIYTEGYGEQPIVIQGAGAGGEVTARGVYSDLLRIGATG